MKKKLALVIGAEADNLRGVGRDVARMAAFLTRRGFEVEPCAGGDATRAGILAGYSRLLAAAEREALGAIAIYFSGHGGRVANPTHANAQLEGPRPPKYFQYIVPVDGHESTRDDFRGIVSYELSAMLRALTSRTPNVTVIFDCCYASQMSRAATGHAAAPRALPHPLHLDIRAYVKALREQGVDLSQLPMEGNPHAVRLVAAGQSQTAWECTDAEGETSGLFTDSLLWALDQEGSAELAWETILGAARERVLRRIPEQRPEVEGPSDRIPFSLEVPARSRALSITASGRKGTLRGGTLVGVEVGDVYAVMPMSSARIEPEETIARATVSAVWATTAQVAIELARGHDAVPPDSRAFPEARAGKRRKVALDAYGDALLALRAAIEADPVLEVAASVSDPEAMAIVRVRGGMVTLVDAAGDLFAPVPFSARMLDPLVHELRGFAVAQSLRELPGTGDLPPASVEVEWGVVEGGTARRLELDGESLALSDRPYIRVTNRSHGTRYLHIFNVDNRNYVARLSARFPSGIRLERDETYTLGEQEGIGLVGLQLTWPEGLPADQARRDEIIVIATVSAVDLAILQTGVPFETRLAGARSASEPGPRSMSALAGLLNQLYVGGVRRLSEDAADRFLAHRIAFMLHPVHGRLARTDEFLFDERRPFESGERRAPGGARIPERLAIRLNDVVIHANRALGCADIRIDALVVTHHQATSPGHRPPYRAETVRVGGVRDGDRLALDKVLLYFGDVKDFVDLTIWVSRDRGDMSSLMDLIAERLTTHEMEAASSAVLAATVASPTLAPWSAAIGASAALVRVAYDVLTAATGNAIGLYRTSLLAIENFGVGRHPVVDAYRARDFSFSFTVEDVTLS